MTSSQKRRMLIIGILGVLFASGGGCLAYLATASSGTSATGVSTEGTGGTGPSGLASPEGTSRTGSSSGGNDTAPPKPNQSISVTGVDLGGNGGIDCVNVLNDKAKVPVTITSVQVSGESGVVANPSGCPSGQGPRCAGARLTGGSCTVGVRLAPNEASGPYDVKVTLGMRATCTNARLTPCDQIASHAPSTSNPIRINWTGTMRDDVSVELTGPEETDSPPPVDEQEKPDTQDTPDTQETPEPESSVEAS